MTPWPIVHLREVAAIDRDGIDSLSIPDGSLYVGLENIESGGRLLNVSRVSNGDLASTKFRFGPSHLLYGKLRPYLAKIALPTFDGVCSTDILPIMPTARLDRSYLAYFLRQPRMIEYASSRSEGINLPRLSPKALADFELPLPSLDEQRRIAAILDQADGLRRKRHQTLKILDALRESIFVDMFVRNENDEWPLGLIDDVAADVRTGPFGSQLLHSEFVDNGIAVLGIDNAVNNEFRWDVRRYINTEKYRSLRRYTVRPGDVLITIMGTCGRCAVVPDNIPTAINTKHLCCITLNTAKMLPRFLHAAFLQHPTILRQLGVQAKGAVMPGLNMGIVKALELRIPPLVMQRTFAGRMEALDEVVTDLRMHMDHLNALFASLQHRAFNGELTSKPADRELEMAG